MNTLGSPDGATARETALGARPVAHKSRYAHCKHLLKDGKPVDVTHKSLGHNDLGIMLRSVCTSHTPSARLGAADDADW